MDLEIRYEHGSMTVHLEEFLSMRSISKVRKLLKIIRCSYTPECEQQLKEFVQEQIEQCEPKQQENQKYIIEYRQKAAFAEQQVKRTQLEIERLTMNLKKYQVLRDSHRKNTKIWKNCNTDVKKQREMLKEPRKRLKEQKAELQHFKNVLRSRQYDFDKNIRNKEFYKKVLKIIT